MTIFLRRYWQDAFLRNSAIFFVGSMVVAFTNYLFYPVLSRMLSISVFGEVQTLISLLTQISILLSGFNVATVHASANCEDASERAAIVNSLRKTALIVVAFLCLVVVASSSFLAKTLHFSSYYPFIALAVLLASSVLYSTRNSYLQGQSKFAAVSTGSFLVALGKLCFAALFVYLGFQVSGAIGGIIIGQLIGLGFVYFKTRSALHSSAHTGYVVSSKRFWNEMAYVVLVFCAMLFVTMLYTADLLIVKHYFSPEIAGLYSGIFTVGNIVVFSCSPIAGVVLASIKRNNDKAVNRRIFFKGLLAVLALGGGVTIVFALASNLIMNLLLGWRYLPFAHLLPLLAFSYLLASLTNLFVVHGIALRKRGLIVLAACGSFLLITLTLLRHSTIEAVIYNFIFISSFALVGAIVVSWKDLFGKLSMIKDGDIVKNSLTCLPE